MTITKHWCKFHETSNLHFTGISGKFVFLPRLPNIPRARHIYRARSKAANGHICEKLAWKLFFLSTFEFISEVSVQSAEQFTSARLRTNSQLLLFHSHSCTELFHRLIVVLYSHLVLDWMGWGCSPRQWQGARVGVGMLTCLYKIVRKQIRIWDWQTGIVFPVFNKITNGAQCQRSGESR